MGFLSYSLAYFTRELAALETAPASRETVYHARQLLKMLDDLRDEGYLGLNDALEASCQGVSRLRAYLAAQHVPPFPLPGGMPGEAEYGPQTVELTEALRDLAAAARESRESADNAFLPELARFCQWVGYREDTAYLFLLRDTLLPYLYYRERGRENLYPWLLGRRTLAWLTGREDADDAFRAAIYRALERGEDGDFPRFCAAVLPETRAVLRQYPAAEKCLRALLQTVKAERILVVESGCCGTFPLLLMSLDDRVDLRMYTTYPYLRQAYGDRIYSPRYEENRLFETLCSQDRYFQFAGMEGDRFYVRTCQDSEIRRRTWGEVKAFLERVPSGGRGEAL